MYTISPFNFRPLKEVRCSGWYRNFVRATVECARVGGQGGVGLDCALKYGCKQGIIMGELRLCQSRPTLTYYADIYDMDVYDRRDDVTEAVLSLGRMGELRVGVKGVGRVGVAMLEVTLDGNVLFKGRVRDSSCLNRVNGCCCCCCCNRWCWWGICGTWCRNDIQIHYVL